LIEKLKAVATRSEIKDLDPISIGCATSKARTIK